MIKRRFKQLLIPFLGIFCAVGVLAVLVLASRVTSTSSSGALVEDVFRELPEIAPDADRLTTWMPDQWQGTRQLDLATRRQVEASYIRAWTAMGRFAMYRDRDPVDAWFAGPAKAAVIAIPRSEASPVWSLGHRLELRFYSNDGSVIGFRDHRSRFVREISSASGNMIVETEEQFDVVQTLENSYWRVRHIRRLDGTEGRSTIDTPKGIVHYPTPTRATNAPNPMRGINYEPRDTPFELQWAKFDERVVANDFDTIKELGLDSIRVFLPFFEFGGETPDERQFVKVERLLDLAGERDLAVVLTLFDGRADHRPVRWAADEAHLQSVITRFKDHPALVMWDVKNEPDRDDGLYATRLQVRAWLAHMVSFIRDRDPKTPITIGWSTADAAADQGMSELVDVATFHWYLPAKDLPTAIAKVRAASVGRPVMIGEFGLPTWDTVFPGGHTELEQAAYYADVLTIARENKIDSVLAWTLHDLRRAPLESKFPWQRGPQVNLGVIRLDGTHKPAAALLRVDANLDGVVRPGLPHRFTKVFWKAAFAGLAIFALSFVAFRKVFARRLRRRHQRRKARAFAKRERRRERVLEKRRRLAMSPRRTRLRTRVSGLRHRARRHRVRGLRPPRDED